MAPADPAQQPTLDTGLMKSGWTWFWIGPFAIFAVVAFLLVTKGLIQDGLHEQWWGQILGLLLSLAFAIPLCWIWCRGATRDQVWITEDVIQVRHIWPLGLRRREALVQRAKVAYFMVSAADTVFDIRLRTKDGETLPLVTGHRIRECEDWKRMLGDVAPVR